MTVSATLLGTLLHGLASARPAANAVAGGTIYSATDTGAITQSDGSSWATFATISSGLTDPMSTRGDIIVRNASNVTARLGVGAAGKILSSDGTDVSWGNGPLTTQDDIIVGGAAGIPTRLAKGTDGQVLTVDPTTHHLVWATPSGGGGSAAHSYLGFNGIGGSLLTPVANQVYMKKITVASAGLLMGLDLYLDQNVDAVAGIPVLGVWEDTAGVPLSLIGQIGLQSTDTFYLGSSSSSWPARWIEVGSFGGKYLTAADYWIGWMWGDVGALRMYYDAGSDRILGNSTGWLSNGDRYTQTDSTHKFSARVSFLTL